jgi:hypothetical protein
MTRPIIALVIVVDVLLTIFVMLWWQPWSTPAERNSVELRPVSIRQALEQEFAEAHQRQDLQAICSLICWDRVDEFTKQSVLQSIEDDLPRRIAHVAYVPGEQPGPIEYEINRIKYTPNLKVEGQLIIEFEPDDSGLGSTTYLVGTQHGLKMIATAAPISSL